MASVGTSATDRRMAFARDSFAGILRTSCSGVFEMVSMVAG